MRNLIFASNYVGLNCVAYLIENFPNDDYEFVISDPRSKEIILKLNENGYKANILSDKVIKQLLILNTGHYDWLLNLWGGYIFDENLISRANKTLNIHPSYLPYCRGRDPVVWTLRYEYPAGVTLHEISAEVDEGAILYREEVPYNLPCKGGELYDRVIERCWQAFCEKWSEIREMSNESKIQEEIPNIKTFYRNQLWKDRLIDADSCKKTRDVILRLLAHDFNSDYTSEIIIDGNVYSANLELNFKKKKEL